MENLSCDVNEGLGTGVGAADQMNIQNTEKAKMKLANVVEKEMGLWRSLFTGAAILEHLEHKYHEVLKVSWISPIL